MRANLSLCLWSVWDCERCAKVPYVVWADDETAQYAQLLGRRGERLVVHQVRRVRFAFENQVVLINPLDDATMIESEVEEARHAGVPS